MFLQLSMVRGRREEMDMSSTPAAAPLYQIHSLQGPLIRFLWRQTSGQIASNLGAYVLRFGHQKSLCRFFTSCACGEDFLIQYANALECRTCAFTELEIILDCIHPPRSSGTQLCTPSLDPYLNALGLS